MNKRKKTDFMVVHCSATKASMDIGAETIRSWHKNQGWKDIGYHFVIRRSGAIELGRPMDVVGAHVRGYNSLSLGICLVGGVDVHLQPVDNFTKEQFDSLNLLLDVLMLIYPQAQILGHRDLDDKKACPCFDAKTLKKKEVT